MLTCTVSGVYPQVFALLLLMLSMVVICSFVHILINLEKRVAFHKIERSVAARLDVEEENKKQVLIGCNRLIHSGIDRDI